MNQWHDLARRAKFDLTSVDEFDQRSHDVGLNVWYGDFTLAALDEWTEQHGLEDFGASSENLPMCIDSSAEVARGSANQNDIREVFLIKDARHIRGNQLW